jgi:hypothetical protein
LRVRNVRALADAALVARSGREIDAWLSEAIKSAELQRIARPGRKEQALRHARAGELRPVPAQQPAKERTEHEAGLGGEGEIGRDADEDAERQPDHGCEPDGGSDPHPARVYVRIIGAGNFLKDGLAQVFKASSWRQESRVRAGPSPEGPLSPIQLRP